MALAVSLRRALIILLISTIFILTLMYWNQNGMKPPNLMSSFEKSVKSRSTDSYAFRIPAEKMWTYKCEGDKCVRYHYLNVPNGERRIPFTTCAMTCGGVNIWPHPTVKTAVSYTSLKFSLEDIRLKIETPFAPVERIFEEAFQLFLKDLKQLQRFDLSDTKTTDTNAGVSPAFDSSMASEAGTRDNDNNKRHKHRRRHLDLGQGNAGGINGGGGGSVGISGVESATNLLANAFGVRSNCDIDKFEVNVAIQATAEVNLNLESDESYQLTIASEKRQLQVHITAKSFFGARHALSTLEQLIWFDDGDNMLRVLSKAIIVDAPKFRYRGLMLDTSRHFFSVEAIKRTIAGMSHAKLNRFHWHITDSQSFPYISKYYPELAAHGAYSDDETYTPEDVKEIAEFAKVHGIQVIPEIDAPAHAGNGWDWGPKHGLGELSLCINQQPWSFYCGEPPCGQLNPKNNNTYLILQRLYEELLNLTGPTDYFHLGGDEVNLECWAQYFNDTDLRGLWCDFMLNAMARLKIANKNVVPKIVSVWSSGLTNTKCLPRNQFTVQVWGGSTWQENYDLIDNGFNVIFSHVDAWYLDCGFGNWRATGEGACSPYRTWQNVYKHRPWERMRLDKTRKKQVIGGEVCMWTEQVDEGQLDNRLWPRSAALGERLWSDPDDEHDMDAVPQEVFKRMSMFRNRLVELGLKAEPIFPKYCAQNPGECI